MANIKVKDFTSSNITGLDLFDDLESFMCDLYENELQLQGGAYGQRCWCFSLLDENSLV